MLNQFIKKKQLTFIMALFVILGGISGTMFLNAVNGSELPSIDNSSVGEGEQPLLTPKFEGVSYFTADIPENTPVYVELFYPNERHVLNQVQVMREGNKMDASIGGAGGAYSIVRAQEQEFYVFNRSDPTITADEILRQYPINDLVLTDQKIVLNRKSADLLQVKVGDTIFLQELDMKLVVGDIIDVQHQIEGAYQDLYQMYFVDVPLIFANGKVQTEISLRISELYGLRKRIKSKTCDGCDVEYHYHTRITYFRDRAQADAFMEKMNYYLTEGRYLK